MADKARGKFTYIKWFKVYAHAMLISCEWLTERAIWELKHVQYDTDIVRWAGITKYVIYRKRGAFDSVHSYTLTIPK